MTTAADVTAISDAVSLSTFDIPEDSSAVFPTDYADVFRIRTATGEREMNLSTFDFSNAALSGGPVVPIWDSAERVISAYGLEPLLERATEIMREVFGSESRIVPEILNSPDSVTPMLVLRLHVRRGLRSLRDGYLDRYAAETHVPEAAPAPALLWTYQDASVPA